MTVNMIVRDGRPAIQYRGEILSYAMYSDPIANGYSPEQWLARNKDFADNGVHLYTIQPYFLNDRWGNSRFWTGEGQYPECSPEDDLFCVDRQARGLLALDPLAKIYVRFGDFFPDAWLEANPEHVQTGGAERKRVRQPSLASAKALAHLETFVAKLVAYCHKQDWGDHIVGYLYYPLGEGICWLNSSGYYFDQCEAMQTAFREWIIAKYGSEERLREAWGDGSLAFAGVNVPTDALWDEQRKKCKQFVGGTEMQAYRDYALMMRELYLRWYRAVIRAFRRGMGDRPVLLGMDMAKQTMMGWQLRLAFEGEGPGHEFIHFFATSGSLDVGEILDEPGLDFLVTPADYTARSLGYGWESEGLSDSLKLRGKTILVENDIRTFVPGPTEQDTLGAFLNLKELRAGIVRHTAWALTRGHMDYWMTLAAEYFHDADIQRHGIAPVLRALDRAPHWPYRETEHAIAMIIDDTSPLYENGTCGYQNLAVLWQRIKGLAHCGIPYRIYLFSDLSRDNMPDYRCYYFPNLFKMDEERYACLKRKVFRDGRMAIFGPATGITDGDSVSGVWASRLLGIDMEVVDRISPRHVCMQGDHPIARNVPAGTIFGDSYPYGPILIPSFETRNRPDVHVLGSATTYFMLNRPGLVLNDRNGEYSVMWSVAVPLPPEVLREAARHGGCHVWSEANDVILACGNMVAIHAATSGPKTVRLPEPANVWDALTGELIVERTDELKLELDAPETKLFYFGEQPPYPQD